MDSERFSSEEPLFKRVAALLRAALSSGGSARERKNALDALARLSEQERRALALDAEWRFVLRVLEEGSALEDEVPGDGPWSQSTPSWQPPSAEFGAPSSAEEEAQPSRLPEYLQSSTWVYSYGDFLRRLVHQEYHVWEEGGVPTTEEPLSPETPLSTRIYTCASALPSSPRPDAGWLPRALGPRLLQGPVLRYLHQVHPQRVDLLCAFWSTFLSRHSYCGVPRTLAQLLDREFSADSDAMHWLTRTLSLNEREFRAHILPALKAPGEEALFDLHFRMRRRVARQIRRAEVTKARRIALAEVSTTALFLKGVDALDLYYAWWKSDRDPLKASALYRARDAASALWLERVLPIVVRQPTPEQVDRLARHDRGALQFARQMRLHQKDRLKADGLL